MGQQGSAKVLVVDDHQLNLKLLQRVIELDGHDVTAVGTIAAAEEAIAGELPSVIVLDLQLPDGDGLNLARRLKADERTSGMYGRGDARGPGAGARGGLRCLRLQAHRHARLRGASVHAGRRYGAHRAMNDLGAPISYEVLEQGTPVLSSDGEIVGTVVHVLADESEDVFDGIVVALSDEGHRFADADDVAAIHERGVTLKQTAAQCETLPEPSENPAVMRDDPTTGPGSPIERKLRRAWDLLSGNY